MNKGIATSYLRRIGLIRLTDLVKYYYFKIRQYSKNKKFKQRNNIVCLPPDYMLFESFKLDYEKYYVGGKETCNWIVCLLQKYSDTESKTILDWGCGPARVTRHLPQALPKSKVYGTDYNANTIDWCRKNLNDITFVVNQLNQCLSFSDDEFDFIIGISIFTHLSEENHKFWIEEIYRIAKPNGVIFITTAGEIFSSQMTPQEVVTFQQNQLVVRSKTKEGHRTFAAFQPKQYFQNLISSRFEILEYKEGEKQNWGLEQDYWILSPKK